MNTKTYKKSLKILDLDIENRPISYAGKDFTFADVTVIACSWIGKKKVHVWMQGEVTDQEMLLGFKEHYDRADIVTGHYLRDHDLPIINGALLYFGLETLKPKLASCTLRDLRPTVSGISKAQESLAAMYGLPQGKYHMNQIAWKKANRLEPEGLKLSRKRVTDDIIQHKSIRERLIKDGKLDGPKLWGG